MYSCYFILYSNRYKRPLSRLTKPEIIYSSLTKIRKKKKKKNLHADQKKDETYSMNYLD